MTALTEQQRIDRDQPERDYRGQANELAEMLGWTFMWVQPLRTKHGWATPTYGPMGKGWPDTWYLHLRTGRVIHVEFKKQKGRVDDDQAEWHRVARAAGLEVYVVRPSDWDRLVAILQGERMEPWE